jgi:hypothetical protein
MLFPTAEGSNMSTFFETIKCLIHRASELHQRERQLTLESVELCGNLYRLRAHLAAGISMDEFARRIGLTPDVYAKRAKAAQLMKRFPRVRTMVDSGELAITSVAALYAKLTPANETMLLNAVANQPTREVERLVARITHAGEWIQGEAEIELRLTLKESDIEKIERAREVLSHSGKIPVTVEVLMKAVEELLERRDPLRRAERTERMKRAKEAQGREPAATSSAPASTGETACARRPGAKRPAIPAETPVTSDGQ